MNEKIAYIATWLVMMCMLGILLYRARSVLCNRISATENKRDWMPLLLTLVLIAARWPTWFYEYELNPDESWLIAGALRLHIDPIPWRSVDLTTSGPLNSFILLLPYAVSSKITYGAEHMISTGLIAISLICWYWSIKLLRGQKLAVTFIIPILFFFVFAKSLDFIHYSTELLPITLISFAVLVSIYPGKRNFFTPFLAGVLLGCVPFSKIQAAPLALLMFVILYFRETKLAQSWGSLKGMAHIVGGATVPLVFAITLFATDSQDDAWRSYILSNIGLSGRPMELGKFIGYLTHTDFVLDAVLFVLVMITLTAQFSSFKKLPLEKTRSLELFGGFSYLALTIYVIWKAGNPWGHYLLFLLSGSVYLATIISDNNVFERRITSACHWSEKLAAPYKKLTTICILLVCVIACVKIRPASLIYGPWHRTEQQQGVALISEITNAFLGSNRGLAVWGYMPQYYALTSSVPATRDVITQMQVWDNPQIGYYRKRYLADFMRNPPDVIVEASGKGNFYFIYHPLSSIAEFPELHAYVSSHYRLLADLAPCFFTPGTRIYLSQHRAEDLKLPKQKDADAAICIKNQEDVVGLLAAIKNGGINDESR
jgi:hypothetical protein